MYEPASLFARVLAPLAKATQLKCWLIALPPRQNNPLQGSTALIEGKQGTEEMRSQTHQTFFGSLETHACLRYVWKHQNVWHSNLPKRIWSIDGLVSAAAPAGKQGYCITKGLRRGSWHLEYSMSTACRESGQYTLQRWRAIGNAPTPARPHIAAPVGSGGDGGDC